MSEVRLSTTAPGSTAPSTTPPASRSQPNRYREIDVLRGFAALWVAFSHYLPMWKKAFGAGPILVPNEWGWYGVEFFFLISGFVIFMTLERCRSLGEFAMLRASRLYPVYWCSIALSVTIQRVFFSEGIWLRGLATNATMFQEFFRIQHLDVVYWSLTAEMTFYVLAAVLFAFGLHRRPMPFVLLWLAVSVAWVVVAGGRTTSDNRDWWCLLFDADFAPFFCMGIVFFRATRDGFTVGTGGLLAAAIAVVFALQGWSGVAVALGSIALLYLALTHRLGFLVTWPTLWMGTISYAFYVTHRTLGYRLLGVLHDAGVAEGLAVAVTLAAFIGVASLLTIFVEQPAMRRARSWYYSRSRYRTA